LTHDIIKDALDIFGIEVLQIRIDGYRGDIYYATIVLHKDGRLLELDARPSDAIALATRTGSRLFMRSDILQANGRFVC
ncbi:MAG: bifunctional nuclease family protein, partial [Candidatus Aenigmarchaeota archaeon]|nr:bifunctional nuclease family protein [Candidatus Aenigmarchaeota archaeon]